MTMTNEQYLLIKLAEEASEIAQIALKASQFGMNEIYAALGKTNKKRIHEELNDLIAIIDLLNDECNFEFIKSDEEIENKKSKLNFYKNYSKELGKLTV